MKRLVLLLLLAPGIVRAFDISLLSPKGTPADTIQGDSVSFFTDGDGNILTGE